MHTACDATRVPDQSIVSDASTRIAISAAIELVAEVEHEVDVVLELGLDPASGVCRVGAPVPAGVDVGRGPRGAVR